MSSQLALRCQNGTCHRDLRQSNGNRTTANRTAAVAVPGRTPLNPTATLCHFSVRTIASASPLASGISDSLRRFRKWTNEHMIMIFVLRYQVGLVSRKCDSLLIKLCTDKIFVGWKDGMHINSRQCLVGIRNRLVLCRCGARL